MERAWDLSLRDPEGVEAILSRPAHRGHLLMPLGQMRVPLRRLDVDVTQDPLEAPDVADLDHVPGREGNAAGHGT